MASRTTARAALSLGTSGHEEESRAYLQRRLHLVVLVSALAISLFFCVRLSFQIITGNWTPAWLVTPQRIVHIVSLALDWGMFWLIVRRRLTLRTLQALDILNLQVAFVTCLSIYALVYQEPGAQGIPGVVNIFIFLRAVIVPSTVRRTLAVSAPAPIALLAIQLANGNGYFDVGVPFDRPELFQSMVMWDQTMMLLTVAIAAVASHVNFALRRAVHQARRLGQYHLDQRIGAGGMGEVFRATHALLKRPAAVKLLRPEITSAESIERFEREVQQTSRLSHPNTVAIYDYGRSGDGVFYYVMEYLDGLDLRVLVDTFGPIGPARALFVLKQICGALSEAHTLGLVHRDIKPGNVILCDRGGMHDVVKVVDFGLVKDLEQTSPSLTQVGAVCGTPEALAPELLQGDQASPQSDLYALGVLGCYLLTGKPIFEATTPAEFIIAHMQTEPVAPSTHDKNIPDDLEHALLSCLRKDPAARPATAADLGRAFGACADANSWDEDQASAWWVKHRPAGRAAPSA
ncbi:MAG: serine/threonine-protein kinase [Planctomycetota bacterium]